MFVRVKLSRGNTYPNNSVQVEGLTSTTLSVHCTCDSENSGAIKRNQAISVINISTTVMKKDSVSGIFKYNTDLELYQIGGGSNIHSFLLHINNCDVRFWNRRVVHAIGKFIS